MLLSIAAVSPLLAAEQEYCIAGVVLNAATGEPLRRAAVTIPQSAILTDAAGAFRFCQLPAGSYYAHSEKPGYVAAGSRVVVGPSRDDLILRLMPLSAITGKVADDDGEPLEHARVQLLAIQVVNGKRKARLESAVSTDDRGEYRIADVTAGRYFLRVAGWQGAPPDSEAGEAFAPSYYGGATALDAADPVTIEPGSGLRADFSVSLRPAYRIRGTVTGLAALVPAKIELLGDGQEPSGAAVTLDTTTGAFQADSVAPGAYTLRATQGEGDDRRRGELPIEVAADLKGVAVALAASVSLTGIVRMQTGSDAAEPASPNCAIRLLPAESWVSGDDAELSTNTEPNGEFRIAGLLPGHYFLRADCASGYISAIHMGDSDLPASGELAVPAGTAAQPIEAVLATDGGTVDVTASSEGDPGPGWVALIPASGNDFYARLALLKAKASFQAVAPGDYQVFAWTGSAEAFEYAKPEARQAWAGRAVSVHVGERERQNVGVKLEAGDAP